MAIYNGMLGFAEVMASEKFGTWVENKSDDFLNSKSAMELYNEFQKEQVMETSLKVFNLKDVLTKNVLCPQDDAPMVVRTTIKPEKGMVVTISTCSHCGFQIYNSKGL